MNDIIVPEINDQQASAILIEGMNRGLYENIGGLPDDENIRLVDAKQLIKAALLARKNGNKSDNVECILFISQVDQKPLNGLNTEERKVAEDIAKDNAVMVDKRNTETTNFHNGIDLATLSDGVIAGLIVGLDKYPPSEQVEEDRRAYLAEKERRENEKAGKSQDESQGTTAQENGEKAGEAAPEGSPTSTEGGNQTTSERETANRDAERDSGLGEISSAQGEDAGAFARAQTPETSPEGKQTKAKAPKEDGNRVELEEQLTYDIVQAHNVDATKIDKIPVEQIQFMIENPDGPGDKKVPITDSEAEAAAVTNKEVKAVQGISAENASPERIISKEDLGIAVEESSAPKVAEEIDRESLEAQLTGPTLKAYGQGRKSVPNLGINELRFMVEHPDGKVEPAELEAAKELDKKEFWREDKEAESDYATGGLIKNIDIKLDNSETLVPPENKETVIKGPPIEEVQEPKVKTKKWREVRPQDIPNETSDDLAQDIITRENFPIPPAYSDEQIPDFPVDMSRCSRDELYSFHAQFHAYETRINYILIEYEDKLNDWSHKKSYREAVVAKSIPFMAEDGRRNTNEYRDVQVKGDEEVLELSRKEHEAKKIVNDLRSLQKNYHLSCERLSRQMSKYENEMRDAPR